MPFTFSDLGSFKKSCHALILLFACSLFPVPWSLAFAQQLPTLSYGTQVFNQVGCTGTCFISSPIVSPVPTNGVPTNQDPVLPPLCGGHVGDKCAIANVGTGAHKFDFCIVGGNVTGIKIWLESTDDNTITAGASTPQHWQPASPVGIAPLGTDGCATLEGGDNHRFLRLHIDTLSGVNPSISAWYRGMGTALPGKGLALTNQGAQPITFNPANLVPNIFTTLGGLTLAKSTPILAITSNNVLYGISASNPNTVPVFASLQCNGVTPVTIFQWEIPANDHREIPVGTVGLYCGFSTLVFCSTSQGSAVDPTNSCLFNIAYKPMNLVVCEVNFAGTTICTEQQIPN